MATQNPYSDSLLADAFRGSLSNLESLGRGFAVAPVGLLGDVNALAREYITPRLPSSVQGLLQQMPAAPTTERILSNIPRVSAPRMETSGMEQLGAAMNPRGPVELAKAVKNMPVGLSIKPVDDVVGLLTPKIDNLTGLPLNADGTVTLFHHTNKSAAEQIAKTGRLKSAGEPRVYLTTQKATDTGYGDVAVPVRVKPSLLNLDDEFPSGRMDFSIDTGKPKGSIPVTVEKPSFTYPQEEAMRLAQQRAALPVEQGGLGLAANNTAEQRAAAMGFDKDVYHGAQNEITNIDFALAGQNTGNPNATLGFFTTPNTEEASRYATLHGNKTNANVIPLVAKSENSYQMPYKELDDLAMAQYNLMMQSPDYNPNEVVKFGDMAAQKAAAERLKKYRDIASEKSLQRKNELMQEGFDSATVSQGKPMEEFIIFNPDSIRSRFAAFDPFRRNAAIAAAMGVAAPNLLAQEQPQSAGLLYPLP